MNFFTADEHYSHFNILEYCKRPFSSTEEMDDTLIKRHNEIVNSKDTVYHLGDFTLKNKAENYIRRLNGTHIFIKGSHDYWNKELPYIIEKEIDSIYVVMCHYAMRTWGRSHFNSWQLYGHSHGELNGIGKQMDVGVDKNNFYPYSFQQIKKIMEKKENNLNLIKNNNEF